MNEFEKFAMNIRLWEPHVHALVDWDEDAARGRAQRARSGPLAGWAIGVKDIIDIVGMPTRCNAPFLPAEPAKKNAPIIDKLESLGAFVMSKTVTTTCAYFDPGPTRNPWNVAHTPGGSSSGSAATVAAGMVRLALGTQTVGSINRPASFCGVVGFKPTYGRFSKDGVFPLAPSLDTVGYFTANVSDARTAFHALTGESVAPAPQRLRIAVIETLPCPPPEQEMIEAVRSATERIAAAGHDIHTTVLPPETAAAFENHQVILAREAALAHAPFFEARKDSYTTRLRQLIEQGQQVSDERIRKAMGHRQSMITRLRGLFASCDLFLNASAPGTAPAGMATGDPRMNQFWTYIGCPVLTLPVALGANGLPLGIQLIAARGREASLLAAAVMIEGELGFSAKPYPPDARA